MTSERRLLAINNYFYRRGGAESVFLDQIDLFAAAGWDVVPFAMEHPDNLLSPWSDYFVSEIEYGRINGPITKARQAAKIIFSLSVRPLPNWGWVLASGVLGLLLGIYLIFNPILSLLMLGFFIGLQLILEGAAIAAIAWKVRTAVPVAA